MKQKKNNEEQKQNFICDINFLKTEIQNLKNQNKIDLDYILNLLKNKIDKNQVNIIISSEVKTIKKEIEILHQRNYDLTIKLKDLTKDVNELKV